MKQFHKVFARTNVEKILSCQNEYCLAFNHRRREMEKSRCSISRIAGNALKCDEDATTSAFVFQQACEVTQLSTANSAGPTFAFNYQWAIKEVQTVYGAR
ncbi:hypothetical protein EN780_37590, partial [Mesorhizobium sp. M4B.F.Ca.ET.089.01.1.1]|uniref:hypothetical protein n=1 Tax=Mesorhizobium sp. M4B.F.Ca.ET.089.01.1.1 TaxID=2496662 RepID=UPI000FF46771